MDKEKKEDSVRKILSEIQIRLKLMEFFTFLESVVRFERTNGRAPTLDERKKMAEKLHINLDEIREAFLENISSDNFPRATA